MNHRHPAWAAPLLATTILLAPAAQASLIVNGSFEDASVTVSTWRNVNAGSTAITGWVVGDIAVDYIGPGLWNAADGDNSVDLDGSAVANSHGSLSQTFATLIGQSYEVSFELSGNPGGGPTRKRVQVSAGDTTDIFTHDITVDHPGSLGGFPWDITYEHHSMLFTATAAQTTLKFRSLTYLDGGGGYGPVIDKVVVDLAQAPGGNVPEPASAALAGLGLLIVAASGRLQARRASAAADTV